jgi:hypothetical protein
LKFLFFIQQSHTLRWDKSVFTVQFQSVLHFLRMACNTGHKGKNILVEERLKRKAPSRRAFKQRMG